MDHVCLEFLTEENYPLAQGIRREDISEEFVDTVETLMELTRYAEEHRCKGHTYLVMYGKRCIGVILLGEAIPWDTDPEQMLREPFYRLMGFVLDKEYRGKGIGGLVLERVIEMIFEEYGVRPIALGIHIENASAVRFYERHGFVRTDSMEGSDRYYLRYPADHNADR